MLPLKNNFHALTLQTHKSKKRLVSALSRDLKPKEINLNQAPSTAVSRKLVAKFKKP
jgi:hypothetical protein